MATTRQIARPKVVIWPDGTAASRIDVSQLVSAFNYTKGMEAPAGQWSVTLLPKQGTSVLGGLYGTPGNTGPGNIRHTTDLERLIRPNALISIGWDEWGGICFGLFDQVQRTRVLAGGRAGIGLTLTGRDFGKIFAMDHIVHASLSVQDSPGFYDAVQKVLGPDSPILIQLTEEFGPVPEGDTIHTFKGATVQEVVDWFVANCPSMSFPLLASLGGTGRPGEFLKTTDSVTTWNSARLFSDGPESATGSLWDFVRRFVDEDFYEVFIDSVPPPDPVTGKPAGNEIPEIRFTVRPKPFDEPLLEWLPVTEDPGITWDTLTTRIDGFTAWEIAEDQVLNEQLGLSDADVFTFFTVTADHELMGNPDQAAEGLYYPCVDLYEIQRAGLRQYTANLTLVAGDVTAKAAGTVTEQQVSLEVQEFRNRLFNWFRGAEYFESGAITVAGRDRYRIGDPVFLPWRMPFRGIGVIPGVRYYTVGTSHAWEIGTAYKCTLRLMRGHSLETVVRMKDDIAKAGAPFALPTMVAST